VIYHLVGHQLRLLARQIAYGVLIELTVCGGRLDLFAKLVEFGVSLFFRRLLGVEQSLDLRRIRAESKVPVLMLTARGDDVDRIVGLEIGADDYLPKPFNPRELVARIRAILRRSQTDNAREHNQAGTLTAGDVELDRATRVVRRSGQVIEVTAVEFDLLEKLLRAAGRIITREELSKEVLGRSTSPFDRSIDMHISNLRKKLGHQLGDVERIKTVRGIGYIYAAN